MASREDGISLLASLINFGAMLAFICLHASVVWHYLVRERSGNLLSHLLLPVAGAAILIFVVINANILAQRVGLTWVGIGVLVLLVLTVTGHRPRLSGLGQPAGREPEAMVGAGHHVQ